MIESVDVSQKSDASAPPKSGLVRSISNWLVRVFMPDDADALARQAWLERRFQSAIISILTAGVIWVVSTLVSVSSTLNVVRHSMEEMAIRLDGTTRADVAQHEFAEINRRLDTHDATDLRRDAATNAVERRVDRIEYVIEREHHIDLRAKNPEGFK